MKAALMAHPLEPAVSAASSAIAAPDVSQLAAASPELKAKLLLMIESGAPHLILTGSDPKDAHGCCPAGLVGAANRLADAGVLDRWRRPGPIGSCPVTVYAFRGEMRMEGRQPAFAANAALRRSLLPVLRRERWRARLRIVLRAGLLAFVACTVLVVAFDPALRPRTDSGTAAMIAGLPRKDTTLVVLFHGAARCRFCEHMDAYAQEGLALHFKGERHSGSIAFREIDFERPEYRDLRGAFGLASTTLAIFEIREGRAVRWKVLDEAWQLTEDRDAFVEMIGREVTAFREAPHD